MNPKDLSSEQLAPAGAAAEGRHVWVNSHNQLDAKLPFGGYKQSGFGRDLGRSAVESYTETKSVCMSV